MNRKQLVFDDTLGDGVKFVKRPDGGLYIEVHSDWAGDTETGFGVMCSFVINKEQVTELLNFICLVQTR
jgi:hypothetical protein